MIEHTLGVVLAGGASVRMGRDKAAIEFDGVPLLERAVAMMANVFAGVVVSGGTRDAQGVLSIPDRVTGLGPLAGLEAGLTEADGRSVFLLAVDMPFVDASTVTALAQPQIGPLAVRLPVANGRRQPLCAAYGADLGAVVARCLAADDRSIARLLKAVDVEEVSGFSDDLFTNVNTIDDLDEAVKRSGRRRNTR